MDMFRLPPALRRSLLHGPRGWRRHSTSISTTAPGIDQSTSHPLTTTTLNTYHKTLPPNPAQLTYASRFFRKPPKFLFSASHFRNFPESPHPEVAFLGRSNVGKSSLLNALLFGGAAAKHADAARVSKKPGRTITMNGYGVLAPGRTLGPTPTGVKNIAAWKQFPLGGGFVLVDMPGYGKGSRTEWGLEIMKYLTKRKQLRRTYLLVDAEHGVKESDARLFEALAGGGIPFQVVLSKVDKILNKKGRGLPSVSSIQRKLVYLDELKQKVVKDMGIDVTVQRAELFDILCCSAEVSLDAHNHQRKIGIDELRWSLLTACGLESDGSGQARGKSVDNIRIQEADHVYIQQPG